LHQNVGSNTEVVSIDGRLFCALATAS